MNAGPDHREPLDAEERALAARLQRIGPFDGPSPALDAKILAAAQAAASTRTTTRRPWLAWIGVPPALVTGIGVAAAAVLALGIVWQLRPRVQVLPAGDEPAAGEEVFVMAEPAATPRAPIVNPPPLPSESAPTAAGRTAPVAEQRTRGARTAALQPQTADAVAAAASPAVAPQAPATVSPAGAAPPAMPADAAAAEEPFIADPPVSAPASTRRRATYTTAARATAQRPERPTTMAAPAAAQAKTAEADAATLDRIEVTGSRVRSEAGAEVVDWQQVAVNEDRRLEPGAWLERIRARRDNGDVMGARDSLRLFRREHPRVRVPDDLRELLAQSTR